MFLSPYLAEKIKIVEEKITKHNNINNLLFI